MRAFTIATPSLNALIRLMTRTRATLLHGQQQHPQPPATRTRMFPDRAGRRLCLTKAVLIHFNSSMTLPDLDCVCAFRVEAKINRIEAKIRALAEGWVGVWLLGHGAV